MSEAKHLVLIPRISEQTYAHAEGLNVYVFEVPTSANKLQIKSAVERQFDVSVVSVNSVIAKGKVKRTIKKRTAAQTGKRRDIKKAFVTLKQGDKIPVFEEAK